MEEDNKIIIFLGCVFIILLWLGIFTYTTKKDVKPEETVSCNEISDRVVGCDISLITADAATLECSIQYLHNELRPEMFTSTVYLINSCLTHEIKLLAREYYTSDFVNNREEIINRIKAIPQQSKYKISSDFSWEILNIIIKVPKDML